VLAPFGVGQEEFRRSAVARTPSRPDVSASRLTEREESVLREHGGITVPEGDDNPVRRAVLRAASANLANRARESLTVEQAAKALLVDDTFDSAKHRCPM
jgi:hypothetical protein